MALVLEDAVARFYTVSAFCFFGRAAIIPGRGLFVLVNGETRICVSGILGE